MKAVWTGLRDHKSLCYALFLPAGTTVSCLTAIQAIVSRLPSIVERARAEHQGFHKECEEEVQAQFGVVARVFPSHFLIKFTRPQCPIDVTAQFAGSHIESA